MGGENLLNMSRNIACLRLLRPGIPQILCILGGAVVKSAWGFPLDDSANQVLHGAYTGLMIDAVSILPPRLSIGTLLKVNEIFSGRLVLVEVNRYWLPLEGEAIFYSLPFRQITLVQRPGVGLKVSLNMWSYHVTGVKVVC